jgi:XRE family transcriptional regulator of biofilm formation
MPPTIAELIRTGRLRKGLNLSDLAEQAGVSRTTLHQLERGAIQEPRAKTLSRIATVLDLPAEQMQSTADSADDRRRAEFDAATNPAVQAVREQDPARFADLTPEEWDQLTSTVGVGGGLTTAGVVQVIEQMELDRETIRRLRIVLQTHLREPARQVIDALYQSVLVSAAASPVSTPGSPR